MRLNVNMIHWYNVTALIKAWRCWLHVIRLFYINRVTSVSDLLPLPGPAPVLTVPQTQSDLDSRYKLEVSEKTLYFTFTVLVLLMLFW